MIFFKLSIIYILMKNFTILNKIGEGIHFYNIARLIFLGVEGQENIRRIGIRPQESEFGLAEGQRQRKRFKRGANPGKHRTQQYNWI